MPVIVIGNRITDNAIAELAAYQRVCGVSTDDVFAILRTIPVVLTFVRLRPEVRLTLTDVFHAP